MLHYDNSVLKKLNDQKYLNLEEYHNQSEQPKRVNIPLYNHQKTLLYYLNKYEIHDDMINTGNSRVGTICSPPGSGKSLIVISQICNKPKLGDILKDNPNILYQHKFKNKLENFTGYGRDYTKCVNIDTNIIVVSHLLIYQWKDYINKYTDLSVHIIEKQKNILEDINEYSNYDIILIKSTFYNQFVKSFSEVTKIEVNNPEYLKFINKYNLFESLEAIQKCQSDISRISKYDLCSTLVRCNMNSIKNKYDKIYKINHNLYDGTRFLKNELDNIDINELMNDYFTNIREINKINSFEGYFFNRVIFDEIDSLVIPNNTNFNSLFVYAITSNHHNLLYSNGITLTNSNMDIKGIHSFGYIKNFYNNIFNNNVADVKTIKKLFLSVKNEYLTKSLDGALKNKCHYYIKCKTSRETVILDGIINDKLMGMIHSGDYKQLYNELQVIENVEKQSLINIYSKSLDIQKLKNESEITLYSHKIIPKLQKLFNVFVYGKYQDFLDKHFESINISYELKNIRNEDSISNIYLKYSNKKKEKKDIIYSEIIKLIELYKTKDKIDIIGDHNVNSYETLIYKDGEYDYNKIKNISTSFLNEMIKLGLETIDTNKKNIHDINNKLSSLKERLSDNNICNICYGESVNIINLNCCINYICLKCFVTNYQISKKCPYCREEINTTDDIKLILESEQKNLFESPIETTIKYNTLHQTLNEYSIFYDKEEVIDMIINSIQSSFDESHTLVFSENRKFLDKMKTSDNIVKISKNTQNIENIINNYNNNSHEILFLDSKYLNFGLNLEKTNHLILTHKLDQHIEKQIVSRAYRIGRTNDLNVYHLYHTNE
jgi:hypothetical protein